jgi:hypothetical protein
VWTEEHARWQKHDLSAKRYVYCWANGVHLEARLENRRNVSWSSSARRLKARRNWSVSPMACTRAHNRAVICCSI